MVSGFFPKTTSHSLIAATNYVKRRSRTISPSGGYAPGNWATQRDSFLRWLQQNHKVLAPNYARNFHYIGDGAEHIVYFDKDRLRAIKFTRPNRFGHSVYREGASATLLEYLCRLLYSNWLLGDDIHLVGAVIGDDSIEIVTSQPWITAHTHSPQASDESVIQYFSEIEFQKSKLYPNGALFFNSELDLVAADAHSRNVLTTTTGDIVAIDVVIGRPGPALATALRKEFPRVRPDSPGTSSSCSFA
jgi:hypothetical protein